VLTGALRRAIRTQDGQLLGQIACISASINQKFLPKPMFRELHDISTHVKILGMNVAHSGTIVGFLLDPFDIDRNKKVDILRRELRSLGIEEVVQFHHRAC
jgi:L-threonine kinase